MERHSGASTLLGRRRGSGSIIGLFKTECVRPGLFHTGPVRTLDDVEHATLAWVYWYNSRRPHTELGNIPPAEHEAIYYCHNTLTTTVETREPNLH